MQPKDLIGTWKLKQFFITEGGRKREWGVNTQGLLIYSNTGHMSVAINSFPHPLPTKNEAWLASILFYAGKWELKNKSTVIHHVENASHPKRLKQPMIREASLENGELTLLAQGSYGVATIKWEKLSEKR